MRRYGAHLRTFEYAVDWDIVRAELAGRATPSFSIGEMGFGANSGAKNSTDHNYLPAAERTGNDHQADARGVRDPARGNRPGSSSKPARSTTSTTVRIVTADVDYVFLRGPVPHHPAARRGQGRVICPSCRARSATDSAPTATFTARTGHRRLRTSPGRPRIRAILRRRLSRRPGLDGVPLHPAAVPHRKTADHQPDSGVQS